MSLALAGCAGTTAPSNTGQAAPATGQAAGASSPEAEAKPAVAATVKPEVAKQCAELGLEDEVRDIMGGAVILVGNNDMSSPGSPACIYEPTKSPSPNGLTSLTLGAVSGSNVPQSYRNSVGSMPGAVPVELGAEGFWWEGKPSQAYPTQHILIILNGTTEIDVAGAYAKGTTPTSQREKYEAIARQLIAKHASVG